ncbi:hypothetical protein [Ramlibacter sp. Leaf400]|uniref:hypothetical protein n=1 Tax=Ramlibacter sp. Leaf400 TaxID=1736365 RepID=UPI0006FBD943|nr:hypothetical protein [Ramlibacter sp. Leaf400]KQT13575.1 hypothetical protein ASG30_19350 [Ramlibacter sp. Leaf400]
MGAPATGRSRAQDERREDEGEGENATPLSEWIAAAIGLVVVLATLACLAWLAIDERGGTVHPVVHVGAIERQGERHHVTLQVENVGAAGAAALRVKARLRRGDSVVEEAEVEFDHVPARSSRKAGVFFHEDPRGLVLEVSVESYREP